MVVTSVLRRVRVQAGLRSGLNGLRG
jgi:hypothetical protein